MQSIPASRCAYRPSGVIARPESPPDQDPDQSVGQRRQAPARTGEDADLSPDPGIGQRQRHDPLPAGVDNIASLMIDTRSLCATRPVSCPPRCCSPRRRHAAAAARPRPGAPRPLRRAATAGAGQHPLRARPRSASRSRRRSAAGGPVAHHEAQRVVDSSGSGLRGPREVHRQRVDRLRSMSPRRSAATSASLRLSISRSRAAGRCRCSCKPSPARTAAARRAATRPTRSSTQLAQVQVGRFLDRVAEAARAALRALAKLRRPRR